MAGESYNRTPVGRIVVRGEPVTQVEKTLTEDAVAGMLVACDDNDYLMKKATSTTMPIGWLAFEYTTHLTRPNTIDEPYKAGDIATVISGGNFDISALVKGEASTGADVTIKAGDLLVSNGDGTLTVYDAETASGLLPVARAQESVTIPKSTTETPITARIIVKSLI